MTALEKYAKFLSVPHFEALCYISLQVLGRIDEEVIHHWFIYKKTGKLPREFSDALSRILRPPK